MKIDHLGKFNRDGKEAMVRNEVKEIMAIFFFFFLELYTLRKKGLHS